MYKVLRKADQQKGLIADVEFEGESFGAEVSFFRGSLPPGKGPPLHRHPYPETCVVLGGEVEMVLDGEVVHASPGDIVIIGAGVCHKFKAEGENGGQMICLHPRNRFDIEWLPETT